MWRQPESLDEQPVISSKKDQGERNDSPRHDPAFIGRRAPLVSPVPAGRNFSSHTPLVSL
ncbi:MAG: hypothetical protein DRJ50_13890 [Actinobacteria bacterium]|nr:MAG: hypothetical protein DRJ50_13890 [Actinomycetota bacterium]